MPAGPQRRFEVTALVTNAGVEVPAYWGFIVADLPPRTTLDLVIPIVPAGLVKGLVQTADGTPPPSSFVIDFDLTAGPPGRPLRVDTTVEAGTFKRLLSTGSYRLSAAFTVSAVTYAAPPSFAFAIAQAAVSDLGTVILAPPGQAPAGLPPEGISAGGVVSAPGLAPGAASTLRSAGYTLQLGALSPVDSIVMQSASYKLRPAAQPLRSVP